CVTPALPSGSSRDPAPIQNPSETERTLETFSEITRSPESSSLTTYFCMCGILGGGVQEIAATRVLPCGATPTRGGGAASPLVASSAADLQVTLCHLGPDPRSAQGYGSL